MYTEEIGIFMIIWLSVKFSKSVIQSYNRNTPTAKHNHTHTHTDAK